MGLTPAHLVFGRELHLPFDLLFGAPLIRSDPPLTMQQTSWIGYTAFKITLVNIQSWPATIKACYNGLPNSVGYHEDAQV
jgi:hypothetical protein